jgi:hypothetical protein
MLPAFTAGVAHETAVFVPHAIGVLGGVIGHQCASSYWPQSHRQTLLSKTRSGFVLTARKRHRQQV